MADPSIWGHDFLYAGWPRETLAWFFWKRSRKSKMTSNPRAADLGQNLFGFGVLCFGSGSFWYAFSSVFFLQSTSRVQIVMSATIAAYGILLWRSAFRELSLANYITVLSCASVLILCAFKMAEWIHFSYQQRGNSTSVMLGAASIQLTILVCISVSGAWWADSAKMHARFGRYMRTSRFFK